MARILRGLRIGRYYIYNSGSCASLYAGKWKQPIAYTFSKSSTKTIDLVRILKAIIKECTEIDLKVLATVSDSGFNKPRSHKLCDETFGFCPRGP
jgi:hypothetical protein